MSFSALLQLAVLTSVRERGEGGVREWSGSEGEGEGRRGRRKGEGGGGKMEGMVREDGER